MAPKKTFPFEKNIEYAFFTCPPDRVIRFHLSLVHYALCFFLTLNFSFFTFYCFSQGAAINTTGVASDPSAMLDVSSTNQGMRIPRVALTSTTSSAPITNPANSLLVYDSVTTGDVTPGFYYWDNNKWIRLATGNSIPTPGPISGITSLCSGASQNYNISAVTGANTYTWTVP
ncbi:MAG: hypothetical protein HGB12_13230, partial [Bacteroidetes bacterium]|nr:hypothetical protein [Bacteroidota bacterium]